MFYYHELDTNSKKKQKLQKYKAGMTFRGQGHSQVKVIDECLGLKFWKDALIW